MGVRVPPSPPQIKIGKELNVDILDKSFKKWSDKEFEILLDYYQPFIDKMEIEYYKTIERIKKLNLDYKEYYNRVRKEKYALFKEKRTVLNDFINKMYDETFESLGNVTVKITNEEAEWVEAWVKGDLLTDKKRSEGGRKSDNHNMTLRQINGSTGEYGVIKFLGGQRKDFDISTGESKYYAGPDLEKFLDGYKVGVKVSLTGSKYASNFPLMNYDPKGKIIEAQVIAGRYKNYRVNKKDKNAIKYKYYIIGVIKPEDIIKYSRALFTLDPDAHKIDKPGGPKYGFWKTINAEHFKTKGELKRILDRPEYQPIEI